MRLWNITLIFFVFFLVAYGAQREMQAEQESADLGTPEIEETLPEIFPDKMHSMSRQETVSRESQTLENPTTDKSEQSDWLIVREREPEVQQAGLAMEALLFQSSTHLFWFLAFLGLVVLSVVIFYFRLRFKRDY